MARQATLLSEQDDGGGDIDDQPQHSNGATIDLTPPQAEGGQRQPQQRQQRAAEPELEIVNTDDQLRPIGQAQPRETALTDAEGGDGTLLDQRRRDEQQRQAAERPEPRRKRVQQGRERTFAEMEELKRQNAELIAWKEQVEGRLGTVDADQAKARIAEIDGRIQGQVQRFEHAEERVVDAMTRIAQGDEGAKVDLKNAMRERDAAVITGNQLENAKRQLQHQQQNPQARQQTQQRQDPAQQQRQEAPQPLSPRVQSYVDDFVDKHEWYQIDGNDRDSRIMRVLDEEIADAGFRPDTEEYWQELELRGREALPHRFKEARQAQPQPKPRATDPRRQGPMVSGAADRGPAPRSNQVLISPERRDALIKAGVMDGDGTVTNPEKFTRICKGYQSIDRENGVGVRQ